MKKIMLFVSLFGVLLITGCTVERVYSTNIILAETFEEVLEIFNNNLDCEYQDYKLYQDFNDIDTSILTLTEDGSYVNSTNNIYYTFTDYFGFGEQNVITKIEYKEADYEDKDFKNKYSLFDTKVGDPVSKLYENMVSSGLMVYTEHNVNIGNGNSGFYDRPSLSHQYYVSYSYRVGPFTVVAYANRGDLTIEEMFVTLEHCNYNADSEGNKIYNYNDGMIYSNDMFFNFPYVDNVDDNRQTLKLWFPENDYKVFIYSKTSEVKKEDVYNQLPLMDEISIHFVKDNCIKNFDPNISALYMRYPFGQSWYPDGLVYDAIPKINSYTYDNFPYYTRVFFYEEDIVK